MGWWKTWSNSWLEDRLKRVVNLQRSSRLGRPQRGVKTTTEAQILHISSGERFRNGDDLQVRAGPRRLHEVLPTLLSTRWSRLPCIWPERRWHLDPDQEGALLHVPHALTYQSAIRMVALSCSCNSFSRLANDIHCQCFNEIKLHLVDNGRRMHESIPHGLFDSQRKLFETNGILMPPDLGSTPCLNYRGSSA